MLAVMSEATDNVRLTAEVPERTRRKFRAVATELGLDMGELLTLVLDHVTPLIEADKAPPDLAKAIKQKVAAKKAKGDDKS